MPFPDRDLAVVAAGHDPRRPTLLLPPVYPIGVASIGYDVIELRRGLVKPRAPGLTPVHGHDGALVPGEQDDLGVAWIDPESMIVVAPGSAAQRRERRSAVGGLPGDDVRDVHDVGVLGIDLHLIEVAVPPPQTLVRVHEAPALAGVVRPVQPPTLRCAHDRIHARGSAGGHGEADATESIGRSGEPRGDRSPRGAAIDRLVEPVVRRQGPRASDLPRRLPRRPQRGEHRFGIGRVDRDVHRAGVLVLVQDLLPRLAAVRRAKQAPLFVRAIRVSEHRGEHAARIARVDEERGNLLTVPQAPMAPGGAAVGGPVDPVPDGQIGPLQPLAGPDVQRLWIGRRHGDRADRARRLAVEDRAPGTTVIPAAPHAAVVHADIQDVRRPRHSNRRHRAATAKRADHAPA